MQCGHLDSAAAAAGGGPLPCGGPPASVPDGAFRPRDMFLPSGGGGEAPGSSSSSSRPPLKMTLHKTPPESADSPSENTDGSSGFGYSQKFFHISDGNLYSVFSPLQGRCYGVRPAFLRQHSGRPAAPLPPDTLATAAPSSAPRSRGPRRGAPSVRGRRSRGLKFHNFVPAEKPCSAPSVHRRAADWPAAAAAHSECRLREEHGTKQITVASYWASSSASQGSGRTEEPSSPARPNDQQENLQSPSPISVTPTDTEEPSLDEGFTVVPLPGGRRRRKPLQTRQVIPYPTYLSMLHEDFPLDLSSTPAILGLPPSSFSPESSSWQPCPSTLEALLLMDSREASRIPSAPGAATGGSSNRLDIALASGSGLQAPAGVSRRPSHRTLIRQRLEDTFKQNGFLVKTKQVSDGDATFCKFKQLRKYTRYYLKSWHQHLPEEVHKLWKGFLPPSVSPPTPTEGEATAVAEPNPWRESPS